MTPQEIGSILHQTILKQYPNLNQYAKALGMNSSPLSHWSKGYRVPLPKHALKLVQTLQFEDPMAWLNAVQKHHQAPTYSKEFLKPLSLQTEESSHSNGYTATLPEWTSVTKGFMDRQMRGETQVAGMVDDPSTTEISLSKPESCLLVQQTPVETGDTLLVEAWRPEGWFIVKASEIEAYVPTYETSMGKRLEDFRKLSGYHRMAMSRAVGCSYNRIADWENNKAYPERKWWQKLCDAFGFPEEHHDWFMNEMLFHEQVFKRYYLKKEQVQS